MTTNVEAAADDLVTLPRRVWAKHRDGGQGSSKLTLLAYDALYDAGRPLTLEELTEAVMPHVSELLEGYLLAWFYRQRNQTSRSARAASVQSLSTDSDCTGVNDDIGPPSEIQVRPVAKKILVERWLKVNFTKRMYEGTTLCKVDGDRFAPGPKPPRILTVEGELLDYTPAERARQAHLLQTSGQTHAILMELNRILKELDTRGLSAEDRFVPVSWLARRFAERLKPVKGTTHSFTDTTCRGLFQHVVKHARYPEVKRAALERLLAWAFEQGSPEEK